VWFQVFPDLSKKLRISKTYLTLIENNKRPLPKKIIKRLSLIFSIPHEMVYGWYLSQELEGLGIKDKKSHNLIHQILKMPEQDKADLLKSFKEKEASSVHELS